MKKIKFEGKLSLNKETIAKLNSDEMNDLKGGLFHTHLWCREKPIPNPTPVTSPLVSCISCTGDLCSTCNGC